MITKPAKAAKGKTWCGPYALALITGTTYEYAMKRIKRAVGRDRIMGMWNWELEKTARRMGLKKFKWTHVPASKRTNLSNMLDWFKPNRIYVVQVTSHYVILNTKDWTVTDNCIEGWVPIFDTIKTKRKKLFAFAEAYRIPTDHPSPSEA